MDYILNFADIVLSNCGGAMEMLSKIKSKIFHTEAGMCIAYFLRNAKPRMKILSAEKTIAYIEQHHCSVARFGDGEFEMLLGDVSESGTGVSGFQKQNPELSKRLAEVLASKDPNLLVCIPYTLNSIWGRTQESRNFWYYWSERNEQRKRITDLIHNFHGIDKVFGDSQVSRPYIAWETKKKADGIFPSLMGLWANKDIIIVEGVKTRMGVGNDLFAGARSIKRILGPAKNAFDYIDEILEKIEEFHTNELIIMALGPTATILAAELSAKGIQAVDIGHIDIEYEWYLRGAKKPELIPGKFTNEAAQSSDVDACNDEWYNSQIVAYI